MKIHKSSKQNVWKVILFVSAVIILIGGSSYAFALISQQTTTNESTLDQEGSNVEYGGVKTENTNSNNQVIKDGEKTGQTESSDETSNISITITASNINDGVLQVRAQISKILNNANCTILLTQGDVKLERTSSTTNLATTSTCNGFDIDLSGFASGIISGTILVASESNNTAITTFTINK